MSDPQSAQSDAKKTPPKPRRLIVEALVIFAISAVLTRVLSDLAKVSALVSEYLFTLVAGVFILVPYLWLTRKERDFEAHALTWTGWKRGAGIGLLLAILTALPFFAGYHVWRTEVHGQSFDFSTDNYRQLSIAIEGRPAPLGAADGPFVQLWREGHQIHTVWNAGPGRHKIDIEMSAGEGLIQVQSGRAHLKDPALRKGQGTASTIALSTTTSRPVRRSASFRIRGGDALDVRVRLDNKPATEKLLRLGPRGLPPDDIGELDGRGGVSLPRGVWWLPMIVLAQLLLVALPEEFFYRGYLQTTFDEAIGGRAKLWIFHISPAILITSALFGIGHFIIDLRPARLAVFFPSLLFGWLRDHTGTIASCIVYHAACNLLVEAATHHYF